MVLYRERGNCVKQVLHHVPVKTDLLVHLPMEIQIQKEDCWNQPFSALLVASGFLSK